MKCLDKEQLADKNQILNTKIEREILEINQSPFTVKLFFAFQSKSKVYMVMEYVPGGELFFHLKKERRFPENRVKFYAAEVILALEYLHSYNIIYRDLKPENI